MNLCKNQRFKFWTSLIIIDETRFEKAIIAFLRMPGLFLIDNYFKYFNYNWSLRHRDWSLILSHFAMLNGFLLLLLPLSHLKRYYLHLVCWITLIYLSKAIFYLDYLPNLFPTKLDPNNEFIDDIFSSKLSKNQLQNILLFLFHFTFDLIILLLLQASTKIIQLAFSGYMILVTISFATKCLPTNFVQILDMISYAIFCTSFLNYFFKYTPRLINDLKLLAESIIFIGKNEGISLLCLKTFKQIFVPVHFLLFWALTFIGKLYLKMLSNQQTDHQQNWTYLLLSIASSIFLSPVSLLSTSIAVTYMSCFILTTIKLYLWGGQQQQQPNLNPNHNVVQQHRHHNGWEEGITTLLLTSITAFTDMNENTKMAVIVIISFVVLSSLLQSILEISEPAILSLNANHNTNRIYHIKVLLLCLFLFLFPLYVTYVYAQIFPVNFWIAVVFSTSLLISARVLDLFIIHCLFWWDSSRPEPWECLDEVIYYARSFTKIMEFFISISVVVVGVWEALNQRSNVINASILVMHCYFNVWQRINHGLSSYFRRREANKIVNSLKKATYQQIEKCDDLCSICYMETQDSNSNVIITRCNHLFHRQCIKKWLAIQNRCPLCTSTIDAVDSINNEAIKNLGISKTISTKN